MDLDQSKHQHFGQPYQGEKKVGYEDHNFNYSTGTQSTSVTSQAKKSRKCVASIVWYSIENRKNLIRAQKIMGNPCSGGRKRDSDKTKKKGLNSRRSWNPIKGH